MRHFLSIVLAVLAVLPIGTTGTTTAASGGILVLGDSLSAGYGISADARWPTLLARKLHDGRCAQPVVNASISGETTQGGLSRLPVLLTQHKPAVLVVELGANDGLRGLSIDQMRDNLTRMIELGQGAGARVLLVGMRLPPNYGARYTEGFQQTFADVARKERTALVPFLFEGIADRPELFQADGIHPVAAAQSILLDTVWRSLNPLLRCAQPPAGGKP